MEPIFASKTKLNRTLYTQTYWRILFFQNGAKEKFVLQIALLVIILAADIYFTYACLEYDSLTYQMISVSLWIYFVIRISTICFRAKIYGKKKENQLKGRERLLQIFWYADNFILRSTFSNSEKIISYASIIEIKETRDYILLFDAVKKPIIVEKTGFENISFCDAYSFICTKCMKNTVEE